MSEQGTTKDQLRPGILSGITEQYPNPNVRTPFPGREWKPRAHPFVGNPALPTRCCCGAAEFSDIHKVPR